MKAGLFIAVVGVCWTAVCPATADESPSSFTDVMFSLMQRSDLPEIEAALAQGADVTDSSEAGEPALHLAVELGHPGLVRKCLDYCADWRRPGQYGQNALTMAVVLRRPDALAVLLEQGADPNTPLEFPTSPEFREKVSPQWLRSQMVHDPGLTPLMLAAASADEAMVRLLLEHGARKGVYSQRYKMPPVSFACRANDVRVTQLLVGRDPDEEGEPTRVTISLSSQRLVIRKGDKVVLSSKCSTGRKGYSTPPGGYVVTSKHSRWVSNIYHVPMPWFMRLNGSAIGIHQGHVPGYPASHGCIRVPAHMAPKIFRVVSIGDVVEISP